MRTDLNSVSPDEKLYVAQQLLGEAESEALPVVENGQFLGLVTMQDVRKVYRLASRWPGFIGSRVGTAEI
jgi:CBS domain-containing protein